MGVSGLNTDFFWKYVRNGRFYAHIKKSGFPSQKNVHLDFVIFENKKLNQKKLNQKK